MDFAAMSNEELARLVHEKIDLSYQSALRAVNSTDPDLGRPWAISILEGDAQHQARQQEIDRRIGSLAAFAGS